MKDDKNAARAQSANWSTMPYARAGLKPANQNTLTRTFETERCPLNARQMRDADKSEAERRKDVEAFKARRTKVRGSPMIKKQRPVPVLKPSPTLAAGPDRAAYNQELGREHRQARRDAWLAEAKAARNDLYASREGFVRLENQLPELQKRATSGDLAGATKEAFKAMRTLQADAHRAVARSRSVIRSGKSR